MLVKGQTPFSTGWTWPLTWCRYKQHKLPCKYPRFTRFMTSLAVRLETSSTSQKEGRQKSPREKEEQSKRRRKKGRKTRKRKKSGRQRMHLQFQKELLKNKIKKGESNAKEAMHLCVHRITSKLFICHKLCSNPHWHSWFKRRSWAFGILPETYLIDTLLNILQVQHIWSMILFFFFVLKREAGRREELKGRKKRREVRRIRVQAIAVWSNAIETRFGAPASSCMFTFTCWYDHGYTAVCVCGSWQEFNECETDERRWGFLKVNDDVEGC